MSEEYIKRGALDEELKKAAAGYPDFGHIFDIVRERVKRVPAADVEPVVRCGKCKYADVGADGFIETCNYWNDEFNTFHLTTMHPNGYCSNGIERVIPHMDEGSEEK